MSDFKFSCPHCAQRLRCDERHAGLRIRCPKCQHAILIPSLHGRPPGADLMQAESGVMLTPGETPPPASSSDFSGSTK